MERIERGETVEGGLGKPANVERIMREAGMTDADIRHCCNLHQVCESSAVRWPAIRSERPPSVPSSGRSDAWRGPLCGVWKRMIYPKGRIRRK
jgi:hypothetical protein